MAYSVTIPVEFPCAPPVVYEALCDLGAYPRWNSGMTTISYTGRMHEGLQYTTSTNVLGKANKAAVTVIEMVPNQRIVLENNAGIVMFQAVFEISQIEPGRCRVTCGLYFKFSSAVFNLARPVVEAAAETRLRGDLETLRSILL